MLDKIKKAIKTTFDDLLIVIIIFLVPNIFSIYLGFSVFNQVNSSLGNSSEYLKLLFDFDRTVIQDWLNNDNRSLVKIGSLGSICFLITMILQLIMQNGYIALKVQKETGVKNWLNNCLRYGIPLIIFNLLSWTLIALITFVFSHIFKYFFEIGFEAYRTEIPMIYSFIALFVCLLFVAITIWIWFIMAKKNKVQGLSIYQSLVLSFKSLFIHKKLIITFIPFFTLVTLVSFLILKTIMEANVTMNTLFIIIIFNIAVTINLLRHFLKYIAINYILNNP